MVRMLVLSRILMHEVAWLFFKNKGSILEANERCGNAKKLEGETKEGIVKKRGEKKKILRLRSVVMRYNRDRQRLRLRQGTRDQLNLRCIYCS